MSDFKKVINKYEVLVDVNLFGIHANPHEDDKDISLKKGEKIKIENTIYIPHNHVTNSRLLTNKGKVLSYAFIQRKFVEENGEIFKKNNI